MPSQFFGLNIAYSGLLAANASLNTTGNNIANVETKGYSRQHTVQSAADALRTFTTYGCAGAGVETLAIERIRNEFYDVKFWNNNTHLGEYQNKAYYMKQIEAYFKDSPDDGINGFGTIFDSVYEALAEVKKNAGDNPTKKEFVGYAQSLCEYFNTMAENLQEMQKDVNAEIKDKVDEINSIAAELATLNKQINVIELTGANANELRDRRSTLIDQLSLIVDVEVIERPILDDNDPSRETGAHTYMVKIAGGQKLVDTDSYNTLILNARKDNEKVNLSDADGLYDIVWSNGLDLNLYGGNLGGQLKALVAMRDGNNAKRFHGTTAGVDVAARTATVEVTEDYLMELNQITLSDTGGVVKLGVHEYHYESWTMEKTVQADGTTTCTYTFQLTEEPRTVDVGKQASVGQAVDYQGIPYYMAQMNEWVRSFSEAFNKIMTQDGAVDDYGDPAIQMFQADRKTEESQYTFSEQRWVENPDGSRTLRASSDNTSGYSDTYYRLTAQNYAVNGFIQDDASRMASKTGYADEKDKYNIIDELLDLRTNKEKMAYRDSSAGEFLQTILADIALGTESAETFEKNYTNISESIDNMRLSVSGVDKDEEALNLVKYQHAYDLASKMIQTLTEVYDRLILETGV